MSAVSLPLSAELPACATSDAAGPAPAAGFIELLSSLAANLGAAAGPDAAGDRGPAAPAPAVPQGGTPAAPPQALQTAVELQARPAAGEPEGDAESAILEQPVEALAPAAPAKAAAGEPAIAFASAIELATPQPCLSPGGSPRTMRPRVFEKEPGEARDKEEAPPAPSSWTIQQALAAVAAIAVPAPLAPRVAKLFVGTDPTQSALPTPAVGDAASSLVLEGERTGDGSTPAAPLAHGAASLVPSLDPLLLGGSLAQARPLAPVLHATPAIAEAVRTSSDPEIQQLDALMRDIASLSGTSGRAAFRLAAEQLGPLDVRLHSSDAGVAVTIRTHDDHSRATVAEAQHQLGDDMRANGLKVAATNVMLGGGGTDHRRQDRQNAPIAVPIEVARPDADPSQSTDEPRPDGRYA